MNDVDVKILTREDIEFAKSIDDDYDSQYFKIDSGELYYLTGYEYPTWVRKL